MNKKQEQQILDYYSTTDKYIRSKTHSNAHQTVFTKESDKYQWLVLEQKSQCEVEVRQTDKHGTITARERGIWHYETFTIRAGKYSQL
jgi:predicted GNAT family acetyltransferase